MSSGEVMVKQLGKLVAEIQRIDDERLTKQTKRFTESLRTYLAEVDSGLKQVARWVEERKGGL